MNIAIGAYRNPLEEWFWESGFMSYLALGLISGILVLVLWGWIIDLFNRNRRK